MGIFIKRYKYKGKDGYRPYFYGKYNCRGEHTVKLCPIMGDPPPSLSIKDTGDVAYERSKQRAIDMLQEHIDDARGKRDKCSLIREAVAIQSGRNEMEREISELACLNANRRRMKQPTEREMAFQTRVLNSFAAFALEHKKRYLWEVDQDLADEYFKTLQSRYAITTISKHIFTLSGAFRRFAPTGLPNPFLDISECIKGGKRKYPITHHRPLTEAQVEKLLAYAKNDTLLYPLIVCALHTGLRLGDVATLRFSDLHWETNVIHRKTLKTGSVVNCPILAPLKEVLTDAMEKRKSGQEYVFPTAAKLYSPDNPKLCVMGKKLFAKALFSDANISDENQTAKPIETPNLIPPMEMMRKVYAMRFSDKKQERLNDIYSRYYSGMSYREIEKATAYSRGQISEDIELMEQISGTRIRPTRKNTHLAELIAKTQEKGTSGTKKRSLYGWHSLRSTYVVLAILKYKLPIELVRKNCGHSTVEMTKNYFDPTENHIFEMQSSGGCSQAISGWGAANELPQEESRLKYAAEIINSLSAEQKLLIKSLL